MDADVHASRLPAKPTLPSKQNYHRRIDANLPLRAVCPLARIVTLPNRNLDVVHSLRDRNRLEPHACAVTPQPCRRMLRLAPHYAIDGHAQPNRRPPALADGVLTHV